MSADRLSPEQRALLLRVARDAIRARLAACPPECLPPADPVLNAPGAVFVTLHEGAALRGCVGFVRAVKPLVEAVAHCPLSAALADPRFPPVRLHELPRLRLEISVLSPLVPVAEVADIQVGRHGLYVSRDGQHGLLLPQVAAEYGWDRTTFLRQTCRKAGLPADAWEHGAQLSLFTVERFTEPAPPA